MKKHQNRSERRSGAKKWGKRIAATGVAAFCLLTGNPALAAEQGSDALEDINKFQELMVGLTRAAGGILLVIGIIQLAISFQSHDASQRSHAILFIIGGILCLAVKQILGIFGV